jgi:hydroxymethylbilane synthase
VSERLAGIGIDTSVVVVDTEGDRRASTPLAELAGRGVFVKEIQAAVLDGRADVAVHSAKDLPPTSPEGLVLASVPERVDHADALVGAPLLVLGPGATVATGAPRRRALLLAERPDLQIVGMRGNVATRLAAIGQHGVEAVVVAVAALLRLGLVDRIAERLDPDRFVPQVGQGAIALECAVGTPSVELMARIDDPGAHRALLAERAFLEELGVGCELPGGAFASLAGDVVTIRGVLLSEDGSTVVRGVDADVDPSRAGRMLADRLRGDFDRASGAG